jgi:hypothetical protein
LGEKTLAPLARGNSNWKPEREITAEMARAREGNSSFPLPKDESEDVIGAMAMLWCGVSSMPTLHDAIVASDLNAIRTLTTNWTAPSIAREIRGLTRVEQAVVIQSTDASQLRRVCTAV